MIQDHKAHQETVRHCLMIRPLCVWPYCLNGKVIPFEAGYYITWDRNPSCND